MPDPDGETRRERNQRFGVDAGPEVEMPEVGLLAWAYFWQLNNARVSGDSGPAPLSYSEIEAWARCTGHVLTPTDVRLITAMDGQYRQTASAELRAYRERQKAT